MTSWMECGCGGDVTLYEYPGEERFGRRWFLLKGKCRSCGMPYETVPTKDLAEFRRLTEEDELRRFHEEMEAERERERQYRASLSPKELLDYLGPECYPWWEVYIHKERVKAGNVQHALTEEDAIRRGTISARRGEWITVCDPDGKITDQWQDGTRPELKRYYVESTHDYTVHDTGEYIPASTGSIGTCTSLEEARALAVREANRWLGPNYSATYYKWAIRDDDGFYEEGSA